MEYLQDFAREQEEAGNILYNTPVLKITRQTPQEQQTNAEQHSRFSVETTTTRTPAAPSSTPPTSTHDCGVLIVATGLQKTNKPSSIRGIELTVGYDALPPTGESFQGKSIGVLGMGNAASAMPFTH